MIGMSFISFLILLIISIIVSLIVFFVTGKEFRIEGCICRGLMPLIIVGWIGGWLGSPVFGYWVESIKYENVYIIPAILGSIAAICLYRTEKKFKEQVCAKRLEQ